MANKRRGGKRKGKNDGGISSIMANREKEGGSGGTDDAPGQAGPNSDNRSLYLCCMEWKDQFFSYIILAIKFNDLFHHHALAWIPIERTDCLYI